MIAQYEERRTIRFLEEKNARICDCAGCGQVLLGNNPPQREMILLAGRMGVELPPIVIGKIRGRPYCRDCVVDQ